MDLATTHCSTCGLAVRTAKADAHREACLSWRNAINSGQPHSRVSAYWEAASSCR